jgi:hypothetical protein
VPIGCPPRFAWVALRQAVCGEGGEHARDAGRWAGDHSAGLSAGARSTALVAERAELAGRIEVCRRELWRLEADVGHLASAIKLVAWHCEIERIRPTATGPDQPLFPHGECRRLVVFWRHVMAPRAEMPIG